MLKGYDRIPMARERRKRPIRPDNWLTQLGYMTQAGSKYSNRPKNGQSDVSLWLGRLPVELMVELVGGPGRRLKKRDEVRYFRARSLLDAGFVLAADTVRVNGEQHVSATVLGEWTDHHAAAFDACVEKGAR
jgi:hypothetical protein